MIDSKKLEQTATSLIAATSLSEASSILQKQCPQIYEELSLNHSRSPEITLWGSCSNVDELTDQTIVDPMILSVLFDIASVYYDPDALHAGIQHTYGYLFSLIETPYGYKRDRWIQKTLDQRFGFEVPTLRLLPQQGTLLGNVSYFLGRIAFMGQRREIDRLRRFQHRVDLSLPKYPYRKLSVTRIIETLTLPKERPRKVSLRTDLVKFPEPLKSRSLPEEPAALLIYSIEEIPSHHSHLITAFPITTEHALELINPKTLGKNQAIRLRFNAKFPGMENSLYRGSRLLSRNPW